MSTLRTRLIRLAHANPEIRPHVLPLLARVSKQAADDGDQDTIKWMDAAKKRLDSVETTLAEARDNLEAVIDGLAEAHKNMVLANTDVMDAETEDLERDLMGLSRSASQTLKGMIRVVEDYRFKAKEAIEQYDSEIEFLKKQS
jgi:flagellar hook-basal body complex protein FliE